VATTTDAPWSILGQLLQLDDVALIERAYEIMCRLDESQPVTDLYFVLQEAFERFASSAAFAENVRSVRAGSSSAEIAEAELEDHREFAAERAKQRGLARGF
jgi:hypothetical protein